MSWIVCERGERWYRAVCRFEPSCREENSRFHIDRVPYDLPSNVTAIARARQGNVIVVWEIHLEGEIDAMRLDSIAMLRSDWPRAIQLGWLPANGSPAIGLAAQEAGIQFLLSDLAMLQNLVTKVKREVLTFS